MNTTGPILPAIAIFAIAVLLLFAPQAEAAEKELSLAQAIRDALLSNLDLKLDKQQLVEAMGVSKSAEGTFDTIAIASAETGKAELTPLLIGTASEEERTSWSVGLQRTFTPGTQVELTWDNDEVDSSPQAFIIDPVFTSGFNLSLRQPLLRGFGSENQTTAIRAARKQEDARAMIVESSAADLVAEVVNSYWDLVFSWQDIEVRKVSLELAEKLLAETTDRIEAGKLAEVELFRPQSEVARREESLISAERTIGLAEDRIKILLNIRDWNTGLKPVDLPATAIAEFDPDTILANALQNRPDLKAARLNREAAEIVLKNARNQTRSSLDLFGSLGINGTDDTYGNSLENIADDTETSWTVGLAFSRPLGNSFAEGERIQAEASLSQAKTSAQILEQNVRRAVRSAMRDVRLAIKNMEATRKTSLASLKGLEAEQVKFGAGRGTTLDVLVAQEGYATALSQEKLAVINYAKTLAELDRIQGIVRLPGE